MDKALGDALAMVARGRIRDDFAEMKELVALRAHIDALQARCEKAEAVLVECEAVSAGYERSINMAMHWIDRCDAGIGNLEDVRDALEGGDTAMRTVTSCPYQTRCDCLATCKYGLASDGGAAARQDGQGAK